MRLNPARRLPSKSRPWTKDFHSWNESYDFNLGKNKKAKRPRIHGVAPPDFENPKKLSHKNAIELEFSEKWDKIGLLASLTFGARAAPEKAFNIEVALAIADLPNSQSRTFRYHKWWRNSRKYKWGHWWRLCQWRQRHRFWTIPKDWGSLVNSTSLSLGS